MTSRVRLVRREVTLALLGCAGLSFAPEVRAEHPAPVVKTARLDLKWSAPAVCPSHAWVLDRVKNTENGPTSLYASATVTKVPVGYKLTLTTSQVDRKGRRTLLAATCEELAEATAVLLSFSLSERAAEPTPPPEGQEEPPLPSPAKPTSRSSIELATGARVSVGVHPDVAAGPLVTVSYFTGSNSIEFGALALLPVESQGTDGIGGRFASYATRLGGCRHFGAEWKAGFCLDLLVGAFYARGLGVDEPLSAWAPRLAPEIRLPLSARRGRAILGLSVGGGVHLLRPSFSLEPYGIFFQPSPVYGSAELSVGMQL